MQDQVKTNISETPDTNRVSPIFRHKSIMLPGSMSLGALQPLLGSDRIDSKRPRKSIMISKVNSHPLFGLDPSKDLSRPQSHHNHNPAPAHENSQLAPKHSQSRIQSPQTTNRLGTERPPSSVNNNNFVKQSEKIASPNSKFDFVCTSEACFRIKKKLNSTAFGKNTRTTSNADGIGQDHLGSKTVSPNMMLTKTKTSKELKMEQKIKELFDNDPIFTLQAMQCPQSSSSAAATQKLEAQLTKRSSILLSPMSRALTSTNLSRQEKMKSALSNFMMKNLQKEANGVSSEHLKLLSDFNIPLHKYNSLRSEDEKQKFLIDHMQVHVKNLIRQLDELQKAKKMNDYQRINEINKRFQNDKGLYAWLQVLTPHTSLHKKLRKALIEKFQSEDIDPYQKEQKMPLGFIGETDQRTKHVLIDSTQALRSGASLQSAIEHTFDDFVNSCKAEIDYEKATNSKRPSFWQFNKTTAETIKLINAKNVDKLKPMHQEKKPKKKKRISERPQSAHPGDNLVSSQSQQQLTGKEGLTRKLQRPQSGMLKTMNGPQFISPEMKLQLLKKEKKEKNKNLNWNQLYEKRFGEHKTEMRIRLADLSSTNSWNQVVLGSFIKLFTKKPKDIEPNLIEEYKNLEYDKVKKIVSSIPSLNECIDKEYFQSIIDKMNKKKIDQVETQISNQVITDYEKEKEKSKVARFVYLKKKADSKASEIKEHDTQLEKKLASEKRKVENTQMANRFRVVLKGLDNNLVQLKSMKEHLELERFHNPQKRGLPEPLELPTEQTEAYRNKVVYEFFKGCPDKPKFKHDSQVEYFFQTTTGGPFKSSKRDKGLSQEQVARAALKIQRAVKRWRRRRQLQQERERQLELQREQLLTVSSSNRGYQNSHRLMTPSQTRQQHYGQAQETTKSSVFVTQSQGNKQSFAAITEQSKVLITEGGESTHKPVNILTASVATLNKESMFDKSAAAL